MGIYIYIVLKEIVLVSIIMMIVRGIVRDKHIVTKGLVSFIVSLCLFIIGGICFVIDCIIKKTPIIDNIDILAFIITALIYVIFSITQIAKKNKFASNVKKKMVYTYHEKNEYIYVIYKFQDFIFLTKTSHKGVIVKLKKQEFADDAISSLNDKMKVKTIGSIERLGIVTCKGEKRDDVYYCYLINVDSFVASEKLEQINVYRMSDIECEKIDKFIILKLLMGNEFDEIM